MMTATREQGAFPGIDDFQAASRPLDPWKSEDRWDSGFAGTMHHHVAALGSVWWSVLLTVADVANDIALPASS